MRQHAVLITILFTLVVTLFSVSMVFWEFYKLDKQQYVNRIFTKNSVITQIYREHRQKDTSEILLEANLAVYNLRMEKDEDVQKIIINNSKVLKREGFEILDNTPKLNKHSFSNVEDSDELKVTMLQAHRSIYFYIQSPKTFILIEDEDLKPHNYWKILSSYLIMIAIILFLYFLIFQRLKPLILLRRKIAKFGDGDLKISFKTSGKDEIALVANELESTRIKINTILESRTLFLRNIMHELKTPIAKGTIATQMLPTQKQRDRFTSIFGRLESLVTEFALIEEVTSVGNKADFQEYRLVDIIDGAIDMAMIERESVTVEVNTNYKINANFRLYATAIKNMIDNGMKYSTNSHITIILKEKELYFKTVGECLKYPINYYIEPFTKDNPSKNSFGLGLYLVDSILKVHDQILAHEYKDGVNNFIFA